MKTKVIFIITGLSGSGKSTALAALEDAGFYCIDNMPVDLLPKFLEMPLEPDSDIAGIALVMDLREKAFLPDTVPFSARSEKRAIFSKSCFLKLKKKSWFSVTAKHADNTPCQPAKVCWTTSGQKKNSWKT